MQHWSSGHVCLFLTISPNEQHSAFVLRLTRYRKNDPFVKYEGPAWQKLCAADFPSLSSRRRHIDDNQHASSSSSSSKARKTTETTKPVQDSASADYEIELDIPEYEVRRIVAAREDTRSKASRWDVAWSMQHSNPYATLRQDLRISQRASNGID